MKTSACFYLLACFLFPFFLRAQTFKRIGVRDGLPSSIIYDIKTDDHGVVWIASFGGGLCRYDGKTFRVLNEDNGLPADLVRCIAFNPQKNKMYVGAQGAMSIITPDSIYVKNRMFSDSTLPNILFLSVSQNTVQTGSNFGLVTLVDDTIVRSIQKLQMVSGYHRASDGREYVATRKGLFIIQPDGRLINFNEEYGTNIGSITDLKLYHGQVLLSSSRGLFLVDARNHVREITHKDGLREENVRCMAVDKKGVLWLGTSKGLASTNDLANFTWYDEKNGIDKTEIRCLAVDKDNILWVGTSSNGMFKLLASDIIKYELPAPVVSLARDHQRTIYALTAKGMIYRLNKDSNSFVLIRKVKSLTDDEAAGLSVDPLGNFYVAGHSNGFVKVSPNGKETLLVKKMRKTDNTPFYSMTKEDKVYLAYKRAITVYDPVTDQTDTLKAHIPGTHFQDLALDRAGNVWIASASGITMYDGSAKARLINHNTYPDFPLKVTNFVAPDKYGAVWAATDQGLICVEGDRIYSNYRNQGFVSNELFGLQIIDTLLFTSCNKGLVQLNIRPRKNAKNSFVLINEKFGLSQSDLTHRPVFSDSTHIWIGGHNAVFRYTPINYAGIGKQSSMFITDILKDSVSLVFRKHKNYLQAFVDVSSPVELHYKENAFTISYVSVNHRRLKDEYFIHRLIGLNSSWSIPTADTKAVYTNLNPGTYTFEVMLLGNPSSKTALTIRIATPFYKTGWFIGLLIGLGLLLVYALFRMRLKSVKKQNLLLEAKVQQRTSQLLQSNEELSKKNRLILESIEYAKKIQDSILPSQPYLNQQFGTIQTAFFYAPKDMVSGDFFYTYKHGSLNYFAVVDCAGHGVPGALLSFSINSILHGIIENIKSFRSPSGIIRELLEKFAETYMKGKDVRESFAISLLIYHAEERKAYVSTISQSVHVFTANGHQELKTSSSFLANATQTLADKVIGVEKGDRFFLYSDGYYDQKGRDGKKMFKGKMVVKMEETMRLDLSRQMEALGSFFEDYKGGHEQIDDVTLFAVEIG